MNLRLNKKIIVMGILSCNFFMIGCTDKATKSRIEAENLILYGKDINGALDVVNNALNNNSDNSELITLKNDIVLYLDAKEAFYNEDYDHVKECIEKISESEENTVFQKSLDELSERVENKEENKKKQESVKGLDYLEDAVKISDKEAAFTVAEAFEIFTPHEEKSPYEDEYNNLMAKDNRAPEEEKRLEEVKETILGASTISEMAYMDSKGVFRLGNQHYLYSNTGNRIIYKVYKNGTVEKVN